MQRNKKKELLKIAFMQNLLKETQNTIIRYMAGAVVLPITGFSLKLLVYVGV